jgi:hypothetical protein
VTLGLSIGYPLKEISAKARHNIPSLEIQLKIQQKEIDKNEPAAVQARTERDREQHSINKMREMYGPAIMPSQLSEKDRLKYLKELGDRKHIVIGRTLTVDEFDRLNSEVKSLESRIKALKALVKLLTLTRYLTIFVWPAVLVAIVLFITGVIRGFDRNIIYSFLLGLAKVSFAFTILVFVAVDIKKTFSL